MLKDIENNRLSHAYMFYGNKGIGKAYIAKEISKKILDTDNLEGCIDFKYIDKKETDKQDIPVGRIRKEVIDTIYEKPLTADKKIYIIDDATKLNIASQNALLKVLEEPPKYICIILIADDISSILSTILSRVKRLDFNNLSKEEMNEYILNNSISINDKVLNFVNGSIGKLKYILDNNLNEQFLKLEELYSYIENINLLNAINIKKDIDFKNDIVFEYFKYIYSLKEHYDEEKYIEKCREMIKRNANYDMVINNMIINLERRVI